MVKKLGAAFLLVSLSIVGAAGAAFATPPSNVDQITTMATDGFAEQVPMIIAVAGAAIAVAVVLFGARLVLRAVRGGGRI